MNRKESNSMDIGWVYTDSDQLNRHECRSIQM